MGHPLLPMQLDKRKLYFSITFKGNSILVCLHETDFSGGSGGGDRFFFFLKDCNVWCFILILDADSGFFQRKKQNTIVWIYISRLNLKLLNICIFCFCLELALCVTFREHKMFLVLGVC